MIGLLAVDEDCPPCPGAVEALKRYIEADEIIVMDINDAEAKYPQLKDIPGIPVLAIISPSTGDVLHTIGFEAMGEGENMRVFLEGKANLDGEKELD